jgi:hypothetical protein
VGGPKRQRGGGDFVLDLLGDPADLREVLAHQRVHLGPRGHRIPRDEPTALVEGAERDGVAAGQQDLLFVVVAFRHPEVVGNVHLLDLLVSRFEDFEVGLQHLAGHGVGHEVLDVFEVVVEEGGSRADAGGVPHDLAAFLAGHPAEVEGVDVPVVLLDAFLEVGDCLGVDEPLVVDDNAALAELVEVLRQRFDLLVAVVGVLLWVSSEGIAQCQQEVVTVAPRGYPVGAGPNLDVRVAAADARRIVSVGEYVETGPHQCFREVLARRVDPVAGTARDSPDDFLCH